MDNNSEHFFSFLDEENEDDNLEKLSASLLQKTKLKTEVRFFYEIDWLRFEFGVMLTFGQSRQFQNFLEIFMPCPFTGHKMFCAGPNFLFRTKNLFTFCGSHKHFVPDKKMICIQQDWFLCWHKFYEEARNFWAGSKSLDQHKTFWDL